jgi:hypothetical protein
MATVAEIPATRKPAKAFYAHLYDQAGVLTTVNGTIYFMVPETGEITTIEPEMCTFLTVLGAVETAMAQWVSDMTAGGYAAVCTSRQMEVA